MSETIDRRVVEMRFDNKEFDSNVQATLTVLDKLKEKLNFKGAEKAMGARGLGAAVDGVRDRFSAMEIVGMTALVNLTNSAINLGKNLAKSLTIDQVKAGFSEYELKMGSIQTIMASTGESIDTVNKYLNDLNTYSDKTIYSFSDMTSSIGKFTNAGVDLDTAVKAIQGISNEAAVSGANANEASRAMYNFAQALSAGYVKLIDWKSIENANMATKEFKQQLIDTAVELGNLQKNADDTYTVLTTGANGGFKETITATKNFNDSLSAAWMTTDVLTATLGRYADETTEIGKKAFAAAQDVKTFSQLMDTVKESIGSGWAQTFEILFGNLEEAKVLWTSVNNVISGFVSNSSDARNKVLQTWKDLGNKANSFSAIKKFNESLSQNWLTSEVLEKGTKAFEKQANVSKEAAKAYDDFVKKVKNGTVTLKDWKQLENAGLATKEFKEQLIKAGVAVGTLKENEHGFISTTGNFNDVVKGLSNIFNTLSTSFRNAFPKASERRLDYLGKKLKEITEGFERGTRLLGNQLGPYLTDVFKAVHDVVGLVADAFKGLFSILGGAGGESALHSIVVTFASFIALLARGVSSLIAFARASGIFGALYNVLAKVNDIIFIISDSLFSLLDGASFSLSALFDSLTETASGIRETINGSADDVDAFIDKLASIPSRLVDGIKTALSYLSGIFSGVFGRIKGVFSSLGLDTVIDLIVGGSLLLAIKKLKNVFDDIGKTFKGLKDKIFGKGDGSDGNGGLFGNIASQVESVLGSLTKSLNQFQESLNTARLVIISTALYQLADACRTLSGLSPEQLRNSVTAVGALLVELGLATSRFKVRKTDGLIRIAVSIRIFASAIAALSDVPNIDSAVGGIGALLIELAVFMKLLSSKFIKTTASRIDAISKSLVTFAIAINLLARPVEQLGSMSLNSLIKGLGGVFGILVILIGFLASFNTKAFKGVGKKFNDISKSLIIFAAALNLLVIPVKSLGSINSDALAQGLLGVAGILVVTLSFLAAINTKALRGAGKKFKELSGSLIVFGVALNLLVAPIKTLGAMDPDDMTNGLIGIAGALLILIAYCKAMDTVSSSIGKMLAIGVSLTVMSVAIGIITASLAALSNIDVGAGLSALFGSLFILAAAAKAMDKSIVGAAAMIAVAGAMHVLTPAIVQLSGVDMKGVTAGLLALGGVMGIFVIFSKLIPQSVTSLALFSGSLIVVAGAMALLAPALKTLSSLNLTGVGVGLLALAGAMAIFLITAKLASGMIVQIFMLSSALTAFGLSVLALGVGLALVIGSIAAAVMGIVKLGEDIIKVFPILGEALSAGVVSFIQGIGNSAEAMKTAITQIIDMILNIILESAPKLVGAGFHCLEQFLLGIAANIDGVVSIAVTIIVNFVNALSSHIPVLVDAGFNLMIQFFQGLADAIAEKGPVLIYAIEDIILAAVQALAQVIPVFGDSAAAAIESYRSKIREKSDSISSETKNVAEEAGENLKMDDQSKNAESTMDSMDSGIKTGGKKVIKTATKFTDNMKTELTIPSQYTNGKSAVQGLIDGLNAKKQAAYDAAYAVGQASDQGMKDGSGVHSPSWKAFETGGYIVQGLVNGMKAMSNKAETSASNVATRVIDSYNDAIGLLNPFNETIVPSFDMSRINQQVASIDASFSRAEDPLAKVVKKLSDSLDGMTDSMNSRSLNVYNSIDGSEDPEAFADSLIRSFRLNARTI